MAAVSSQSEACFYAPARHSFLHWFLPTAPGLYLIELNTNSKFQLSAISSAFQFEMLITNLSSCGEDIILNENQYCLGSMSILWEDATCIPDQESMEANRESKHFRE